MPLMALTATANEKCIADIKHTLGIGGCTMLTQTFNRPNLYYEVRMKSNNVLAEMAKIIEAEPEGASGIIYCLGKITCEVVAEKLTKQYGITAHHYHAS